MMFAVLTAWAMTPSGAIVDAEGERVLEELIRYSRDNLHKPADIQYAKLIRSHPTMITDDVHQLGANAARGLGDLVGAAQRLRRIAPGSELGQQAAAALQTLEATYGLVMVSAGSLEPVAMPFAPEARTIVTRASEQVGSTGLFVGLLPVGEYRVDGEARAVVAGWDWNVLGR